MPLDHFICQVLIYRMPIHAIRGDPMYLLSTQLAAVFSNARLIVG
jgi:hypothetical protein